MDSNRSRSPVKSCSALPSHDPHRFVSPSKSSNPLPSTNSGQISSAFSRSNSPVKYRNLNTQKSNSNTSIIKGSSDVPDAVPLINEPYSTSVKARAAAFDIPKGKISI